MKARAGARVGVVEVMRSSLPHPTDAYAEDVVDRRIVMSAHTESPPPERHPSPDEPTIPEIEADETIAPRPEEEIADLLRAEPDRSEEQTSELQSLMRNSYAVFCFK